MSNQVRYALLGDVPIIESLREDQLNFEHHAKVLGDATVDTREPITIGVFGEWGTGKTSLMKLIEKKVGDSEKAIPVWFNAWQYEKEEHLIVPLIATIRKQIDKKLKDDNWLKKFGDGATKVKNALMAVAYGFTVKGKVGIPLISEAEVNLSAPKMMDKYRELTKDSVLDRSLYFDAFEQLSESSKSGKNSPRIVVFVDDLDRCFPPKAVELLESIKLVLNQPGFSFVIGVYENIIREFVSSKYADEYKIEPSYFDNYLDKIVQVKVKVPERKPDDMKDYIRALIKEGSVFEENYNEGLITLIAEASKRNPRSVVRLLNRVMVTMRIWVLEKEKNEQPDPTALILDIATDDDYWSSFKDNLDVSVYKEDSKETITFGELIAESLEGYKDKKEVKPTEILENLRNLKLKSRQSLLDEMVSLLLKNPHICTVLRTEAGLQWLRESNYRLMIGLASEQTMGETKATGSEKIQLKKSSFLKISMVELPGGEFTMGDESENDAKLHTVRLSPFSIQETPVTQQQYEAVMGKNPSEFDGKNNPVESVSWNDAAKFCNELSKKEGLEPIYDTKTGEADFLKKGYHLPTEAQWEFAGRAGSNTNYCFGDNANELGEYAWYDKNSENTTHPVGKKKPNKFGLYDMHGNVWEWCNDYYDSKYYELEEAKSDPKGPASGSGRVVRGGSWINDADGCRVSMRHSGGPDRRSNGIGFRLALSL